MIHRLLLSFALLTVLPVFAVTLSFTDVTDRYRDAPFNAADTAGISVLTILGAVEGNPDGTFAPGRSLNRAEFLKIIVGTTGVLLEPVSTPCFPDLGEDAWYLEYICYAKQEGIVSGYPDGTFRPGQSVNYAEALKMLGELFGIIEDVPTGADWFTPYREGAYVAGIGLPGMEAQMARQLTRGQMARLTAAYIAHREGQLEAYRAFEKDQSIDGSSVSFASSSSSSVAPASPKSANAGGSVASSASSLPPSVSHFLLLGARSPILSDGVFLSPDQDGKATEATVTLSRKTLTFTDLVLVDGDDHELAVLVPRTSGTDEEMDKEWRGTIAEGALTLSKGKPLRLGVRAHVKGAGNGGTSNEMVEVKKMELRVAGGNSVTLFLSATDTHFSVHQTSLGRIIGMENVLATSMSLAQGSRKTLASFTLSATGSAAQLGGFTFMLDARDTAVTNVWIGGSTEAQQTNCGLTSQNSQLLISCPVLPEGFRVLNSGSITLSLYADLTLTGSASAGFVQVRPLGHGTVTTEGVLRWTDGAGVFNWVEEDVIIDVGPMLTVTR